MVGKTILSHADDHHRVLLLSRYLPETWLDEIVRFRHEDSWSFQRIVDHITDEQVQRQPSITRWTRWQRIVPANSTYDALTAWWSEWRSELRTLNFPPEFVLEQFCICLNDFFPQALKEVLRLEKNMGKTLDLQDRYAHILDYVRVEERTAQLPKTEATDGATSSANAAVSSIAGQTRNTNSAKPAWGACFVCQSPGHWARDCPHKYNMQPVSQPVSREPFRPRDRSRDYGPSRDYGSFPRRNETSERNVWFSAEGRGKGKSGSNDHRRDTPSRGREPDRTGHLGRIFSRSRSPGPNGSWGRGRGHGKGRGKGRSQTPTETAEVRMLEMEGGVVQELATSSTGDPPYGHRVV